MKTEFKVLNPSHSLYKKGKLVIEFEDNNISLKRMGFYIDQNYFFVPLHFVPSRRVNSTWVFQKDISIKALTNEELEKIFMLSQDVAQNNKVEENLKKLLLIIPRQIEIYKQLTQTKMDAKQRKKILRKLNEGNTYISKVNEFRAESFNLNLK